MTTSRHVPLRGIADSIKRESAPPAQQVLSGAVGATVGDNGVSTITTSQGTFQAQFFDTSPTTYEVSGQPGSVFAGIGANFGIGVWNQAADIANTFMTQLTVGQYSLNMPSVPTGSGAAAISGQALAIALPMMIGEDATGRVHGEIPDSVPANWTREQLEQLAGELKRSIQARMRNMVALGDSPGHANRIRQERRLLRQILKKLSGS